MAHAEEISVDAFFQKYPGLIYQDLVVHNTIYPVGTDLCSPRYELIKPIFDIYKDRPFSFLDLGAAQGYFSLRTAHDYKESGCVMIEANNTSYYAHHGSMLHDLCLMNSHLKNIFYLDRRMSLADITYLKSNEHFDVVIAFLVVHLMHEKLQGQTRIIEALLELGDNVIIEVANDVNVLHTAHVEYLGHIANPAYDCTYLGEVKRHKDPKSTSTGKMFWFRKKVLRAAGRKKGASLIPLQASTFNHLHGVYPKKFPE